MKGWDTLSGIVGGTASATGKALKGTANATGKTIANWPVPRKSSYNGNIHVGRHATDADVERGITALVTTISGLMNLSGDVGIQWRGQFYSSLKGKEIFWFIPQEAAVDIPETRVSVPRVRYSGPVSGLVTLVADNAAAEREMLTRSEVGMHVATAGYNILTDPSGAMYSREMAPWTASNAPISPGRDPQVVQEMVRNRNNAIDKIRQYIPEPVENIIGGGIQWDKLWEQMGPVVKLVQESGITIKPNVNVGGMVDYAKQLRRLLEGLEITAEASQYNGPLAGQFRTAITALDNGFNYANLSNIDGKKAVTLSGGITAGALALQAYARIKN